jgi:hypothetical protein
MHRGSAWPQTQDPIPITPADPSASVALSQEPSPGTQKRAGALLADDALRRLPRVEEAAGVGLALGMPVIYPRARRSGAPKIGT